MFTLPLENHSGDVAHAVYTGNTTSDNGDSVSEQTTIDLTHTPVA